MSRSADDVLFYQATLRGFVFDHAAAAGGGPLVGVRRGEEWIDTIHLEGLAGNCAAWRRRPGEDGSGCRVEGSATTVLTEAINWGTVLAYSTGACFVDVG